MYRAFSTQAGVFGILQDVEQFRLGAGRHLPDLIKHDGTFVRQFKPSGLFADGTREGPTLVAEKFGFQQIFWYRTTLTDSHAQRPPTFGINHDVAQTPLYGLFDTGDRVFDGSAH